MDPKWKNSLCFVEFSYFLFLSSLQPYFLLEEEPRQVSTFFVLPVKCYPYYILKNEMEPAGALENMNLFKVLCGKCSGKRGRAVIWQEVQRLESKLFCHFMI